MANLSELRKSTGAAACLTCGKCTTLCPFGGTDGFSPRRLASVHDRSAGPWRAAGVARCLTCGTCELRCPQGVSFSEFVRGLREIASDDLRPEPPHGGIFGRAAHASLQDANVPRNLDWLPPEGRIATEGEIGLFVGCLPLFDLYFSSSLGLDTCGIARAAILALNRLGIEPVVLAEERCCGHDQLWAGNRPTFEELAQANVAAFQRAGVTRILTTCAECCRTWRIDYANLVDTYRPTVQHFAEFVAQEIEAGRAELEGEGTTRLTYQDPCRLGRHLDVVDAPRRALTAIPGVELREMASAGPDAVCCGTSGFIHCDAESRRLQMQRLKTATDTGADLLVTACPKCLIHFSCARQEEQNTGREAPRIGLADLSQLAAERLRASENGGNHD